MDSPPGLEETTEEMSNNTVSDGDWRGVLHRSVPQPWSSEWKSSVADVWKAGSANNKRWW